MRRPSPSREGTLVTAIGLTGGTGALGALITWGVQGEWAVIDMAAFLAFPLFVAIGDLLEIPLERRSVFSLGLAPAIAYVLLRSCIVDGIHGACLNFAFPHLGEVVAVFLVGATATTLFRLATKRELRLQVLATRVLVVLAAAAVYRGVVSVGPDFLMFGPERIQVSAPGLAALFATVIVLEVAMDAMFAAARQLIPVRQALIDQMRTTGLLLLSTVSVGVLLALAYPTLKGWTIPVFLAPLTATHYSFRQVATIRKNYLQTVRALSKVPEMAGYTVRGHSTRVARLSVEIATELAVGDPELHEIEYAALLHDIGRVSLPDPEEQPKSTSALELALVGAEIVEKTGHFPRVALMVQQQQEPYRRRGEDANRELSAGAKIIKIASAYDDLTEPPGPGRTAWDALERLHLGMAYDYDPRVIQALTRVLEKRGLI